MITFREIKQLRYLMIAVFIIIVLSFSYLTIQRNITWKDPVAFWETAAESQPDSALAHYNLGRQYQLRNGKEDLDRARAEYIHALSLKPDYSDAHFNLALLYTIKGQGGDAANHYIQAIRFGSDPEAYYNLGIIYHENGELEQAVKTYSGALQLKPDYVKARLNLAIAYGQLGDLKAAKDQFQTVLQYDPENEIAINALSQLSS